MEDQGVGKYIKVLSKLSKELKSNFVPEDEFPLNKSEFITLMELRAHPGLPMKHYQKAAGIESGSFTYLADELEKKGLARRTPAEDDKRKTVLTLTEKGSHIANVICVRVDAHVAERIAGLRDEQKERFVSAMSVLEDILTQLEKQHG